MLLNLTRWTFDNTSSQNERGSYIRLKLHPSFWGLIHNDAAAQRLNPDRGRICTEGKNNKVKANNQVLPLILSQLLFVCTGSAVSELREHSVSFCLSTLGTWTSLVISKARTVRINPLVILLEKWQSHSERHWLKPSEHSLWHSSSSLA